MMNFLGNVIWFLFAGLWQGIGWLVAGLLWSVTIVGIPVGRQCFKLAALWFCPFGRDVEPGGGVPSFLMNVIWLLVSGLWLALAAAQRLAPVPDGGGYSLRHAVLQAGSAVAVAIWRAHRLPIKRRARFPPWKPRRVSYPRWKLPCSRRMAHIRSPAPAQRIFGWGSGRGMGPSVQDGFFVLLGGGLIAFPAVALRFYRLFRLRGLIGLQRLVSLLVFVGLGGLIHIDRFLRCPVRLQCALHTRHRAGEEQRLARAHRTDHFIEHGGRQNDRAQQRA